MTTATRERLYELLPAIYRIRDAEGGEALHALLTIMGDELARIEDDIAGLYDDWFIETCAEWVVPYIGDLLGVRGLHQLTEVDGFQPALPCRQHAALPPAQGHCARAGATRP